MEPGHVLLNTVIQSLYGIIHIMLCMDKCEKISTCRSVNWYTRGLCQLNSETHLSYPEGFVANVTGDYMIYGLHPRATCSNKMCAEPSRSVCLMEADGINFGCKGV